MFRFRKRNSLLCLDDDDDDDDDASFMCLSLSTQLNMSRVWIFK
jgi:hypothetical protein